MSIFRRICARRTIWPTAIELETLVHEGIDGRALAAAHSLSQRAEPQRSTFLVIYARTAPYNDQIRHTVTHVGTGDGCVSRPAMLPSARYNAIWQ